MKKKIIIIIAFIIILLGLLGVFFIKNLIPVKKSEILNPIIVIDNYYSTTNRVDSMLVTRYWVKASVQEVDNEDEALEALGLQESFDELKKDGWKMEENKSTFNATNIKFVKGREEFFVLISILEKDTENSNIGNYLIEIIQ